MSTQIGVDFGQTAVLLTIDDEQSVPVYSSVDAETAREMAAQLIRCAEMIETIEKRKGG